MSEWDLTGQQPADEEKEDQLDIIEPTQPEVEGWDLTGQQDDKVGGLDSALKASSGKNSAQQAEIRRRSRETGIAQPVVERKLDKVREIQDAPDLKSFAGNAPKQTDLIKKDPGLMPAIKDDLAQHEQLEKQLADVSTFDKVMDDMGFIEASKASDENEDVRTAELRGAAAVGVLWNLGTAGFLGVLNKYNPSYEGMGEELDPDRVDMINQFTAGTKAALYGEGEWAGREYTNTDAAEQLAEFTAKMGSLSTKEQVVMASFMYKALPKDKRMEVAMELFNDASDKGSNWNAFIDSSSYILKNPGAVVNTLIEFAMPGGPGGRVGGVVGRELTEGATRKLALEGAKKEIAENTGIAVGVAGGENFAGVLPMGISEELNEDASNLDEALTDSARQATGEMAGNMAFKAIPAVRAPKTGLGAAGKATAESLKEGFGGAFGAYLGNAAVGQETTLGEMFVEFGIEIGMAPVSISNELAVRGDRKGAELVNKTTGSLQTAAKLHDLMDTVAGMNLKEHDPEALREIVNEINKDSDSVEIFIDPNKLLQEGGIDRENLVALIPSIEGQLDVALETGGTVRMQTADVLMSVAGTEYQGLISRHSTFDPEAWSEWEALNEAPQFKEILDSQRDALLREYNDSKEVSSLYDQIHKDVKAKFTAGGASSDAADLYANLMSSAFMTQAKNEGMTPQQMNEKYFGGFENVEIQELMAMDPETTLNTAKDTGYEGADAAEATEWNVAAARGLDLSPEARTQRAAEMGFDTENVLYHGSESLFNEFQPSEGEGTHHEDDQITGVYMTDSKEGADFFAKNEHPRYLKQLYTSISNPYRVETKNQLKEELGVENLADVEGKLTEMGHDGVIIESGFYAQGGPWREIISFDTSKIRSIDAAFDPDAAASSDLLAQSDVAPKQGEMVYSAYEPEASTIQEPKPDQAIQAQDQGDLFAASSVPAEVKTQQAEDNFNIRYEAVETTSIPSGLDSISSPEDAAHVVAHIRKHAQETSLAVVTDADGKILHTIRHTKGLKDSANISPVELVAGIVNTPGAKNVWLAHNHPSGNPEQSQGDLQITKKINQVLDGTGIEMSGHIIVGDGQSAKVFNNTDRDGVTGRPITPTAAPRRGSIGLTERVIRKRGERGPTVSSPDSARVALQDIEADHAVMLMDNRHNVLGSIALAPEEMKALRENGRVNRVFSAIDQTNAAAVIIKTDDQDAATNISKFFNNAEMRVLDWMYPDGDGEYQSDSEKGGSVTSASGVFNQSLPRAPGESNLEESYNNSDTAEIENEYTATREEIALRLSRWWDSTGLKPGGGEQIVSGDYQKAEAYEDERGAGPFGKTDQAGKLEQQNLLNTAKEQGFFFDDDHPLFDAVSMYDEIGGQEHDAWIVGETGDRLAIRMTQDENFGHTGNGSPADYLRRIETYNKTFPHLQIQMLGVGQKADGTAEIWSAQKFAPGKPFESMAELDQALRDAGWFPEGIVREGAPGRYRNKDNGAIIGDVKEDNILRGENGELYPIDVYVEQAPLLMQNQTTGARGAFDINTRIISELANADLSTVLHEMGHLFLEMQMDLALQPGASSALTKDVDTLLRWFNVPGATFDERLVAWNKMTLEEKRPHHEKFAESFERYLFEGKAPSKELEKSFRTFRAWLTQVYTSVSNFIAGHSDAAGLPDTVRGVMDRVLATQDQISEMEQRRSVKPLLASKDEVGASDAEWAEYQEAFEEAAQSATDNLASRSLRDMKWFSKARSKHLNRLRRDARQMRKDAVNEAKKIIADSREYQVQAFLTRKVRKEDRPENRKTDPEIVDPEVDSLFVAIAKLGGIDGGQARSEWGVIPADFKKASGLFGKPLLRAKGKGLSLDYMLEALVEQGYIAVEDRSLVDITDLEVAFMDEAIGNLQYSAHANWDLLTETARQEMPDMGLGDKVGGRLNSEDIEDLYRSYGLDMDALPQEVKNSVLEQAGYHGTPHKFSKFSLDAIGSGEGVQVYGWGIYIAGRKSVAEWYRDNLTSGKLPAKPGDVSLEAERKYDIDNPEAFREYLESIAVTSVEVSTGNGGDGVLFEFKDGSQGELLQYESSSPPFFNSYAKKADGNLFTVDLPEDSDFMHYSSDLSERPDVLKKIQAAMHEDLPGHEGSYYSLIDALADHLPGFSKDEIEMMLPGLPGKIVYQAVESAVSHPKKGEDQVASEWFGSLGIPGLMYADALSRSMGSKWTVDGLNIKDASGLNYSSDPQVQYQLDDIFQKIEQGYSIKDIKGLIASMAYTEETAAAFKKIEFVEPQGTHNYVVWDENAITVEAVNDEIMQADKQAETEEQYLEDPSLVDADLQSGKLSKAELSDIIASSGMNIKLAADGRFEVFDPFDDPSYKEGVFSSYTEAFNSAASQNKKAWGGNDGKLMQSGKKMSATEKWGNLANLEENAKAAAESQLSRKTDMEKARIMLELDTHAGTPWAAAAIKGLVFREFMDRASQGQDTSSIESTEIFSKSIKANKIIRAFKAGPEAVDALTRTYDFLGENRKAENHVSASFINCAPSKSCAKFCYAATNVYPNEYAKAEFTEWATENKLPMVADNIYLDYQATAQGIAGLALRINDKGELSESQVKLVAELNKRGTALQVFSKRPELLRQLDDINLKMLSIDASNFDLALANPDLQYAVTLTEDFTEDMIQQINGQVAVYLPVNLKGIEWNKDILQSKFPTAYKSMKKRLCPVDGGKAVTQRGTSFVEIVAGAAKKATGKNVWTCTACDKLGTIGCFHGKNQTSQRRMASQLLASDNEGSQAIIKKQNDFLDQAEELFNSGAITDETYQAILKELRSESDEVWAPADSRREEDTIAANQAESAKQTGSGKRAGQSTSTTLSQSEIGIPGFRSGLLSAARGLKQEKGTPGQMLGAMKKLGGVKQEELEWIQLDKFLEAAGKTVTKGEIVAFIEQNGVRLEELVKGDKNIELSEKAQEKAFDMFANNFADFYVDDTSDLYFSETVSDGWMYEPDRAVFNVGTHYGFGDEEQAKQDAYDRVVERIKKEFDNPEDVIDHMQGEGAEANELNKMHELHNRAVRMNAYKIIVKENTPELSQIIDSFGNPVTGWNTRSETDKKFLEYQSEARASDTKFGDQVMPGGTNYQERLFILPTPKLKDFKSRADYNEAIERQDERGGTYHGGHWDEDGVLAHIRLNDRILDNGDKAIHLEEVQSDQHQAGSKKGYGKKDRDAFDGELKAIEARQDDIIAELAEKNSAHNHDVREAIYGTAEDYEYPEFREKINNDPLMAELNDLRKERSGIAEKATVKSMLVPDAPFKNNSWVELAAKRAIMLAIDGGYEALTWTPGDVQKDRYSLSKQISKVEYSEEGGILNAYDLDGFPSIEKSGVDYEQLENYVGKDLAKKIADMDGEKSDTGMWKTVEGLDLDAGGAGFKSFYDKTLKNIIGNVAKKMDKSVKVGTTTLNMGKFVGGGNSWAVVDNAGNVAKQFDTEDEAGDYAFNRNSSVEGFGDIDPGTPEFEALEEHLFAVITPDDLKLLDKKADVWMLPITDEMREKARAGQKLFQPPKDDDPEAGDMEGKMDPDQIIDSLGSMADPEGIHPEIVAEEFGYSSADEMIRELIGLKPAKEAIEELADKIMLERHAELSSEKAMEAAADAAIHNEARIKAMETELQIMAKAERQVKLPISVVRDYAVNLIAGLRIMELRPSVYTSAATKAGKNAEKAMRNGLRGEALLHKRNQLLHTYSAKVAIETKEQIEKDLRYLKKFNKLEYGKKLGAHHYSQITALLERFDLREKSQKAIQKKNSLAEWVEEQKELGVIPPISQKLINDSFKKNYKEMTVEEMQGLVDAVKHIEHIGRTKNSLLTAKEKREIAASASEMADSIEANKGTVDQPIEFNSKTSGMKELSKRLMSSHRKFASLARQMDGNKVGPVWRNLIRPMNEAGDREAVMRENATIEMTEVFRNISGKKLLDKVFIPEIGTSLSLEGRLSVALNWGNEGNRQRLMDGGLGGNIKTLAPDQVRAILNTLDKNDWQFVQGVWDQFESYRPQIAAQERKLTGVEPKWIEPMAIENQYGTWKGGYYPAKYEVKHDTKSKAMEYIGDLTDLLTGAKGKGKTKNSHTQARASAVKGRPLKLDFSPIFQHITQVTHRLAWQDWVSDASKLVADPKFDKAVRERYGYTVLAEIQDTIQDIALGDIPTSDAIDAVLNHIRVGATIVGLGWNLSTAMLQPLGLTQSAVRIGSKWVLAGAKRWAMDPNAGLAEVQGKSDFMRLRAKTMQRELNEVLNVVRSEKLSHLEASYFYMIQKMQIIADLPTWYGEYEKAIAQKSDEAEAIARADQAVMDAQGGGMLKDLSAVQRGGPARKIFTNFYSYFNVTFNLTAESVGAFKHGDKNSIQLMTDLALLYWIPATLGYFVRQMVKGFDEDDDWQDHMKGIAQENMSYMMGTIVLGREMAPSSFTYSGPAGLRLISEVSKLGKQVGQMEVDGPLLKSLNNTAGVLLHYPAGQINRAVDGGEALIEGKTKNPLVLMGGHRD